MKKSMIDLAITGAASLALSFVVTQEFRSFLLMVAVFCVALLVNISLRPAIVAPQEE